jgi:hypothetical protein
MTNPRPAPQLHRLTVLQCGCCARTAEIILTSDTDQQVCDPCKVHWGNTSTKTARREREHRIWWSERLGIVENELVNQKIAAEHRVTKLVTAARNNEQQLRGQIENLHHEIDHVTRGHISEDSRTRIESEHVRAANDDRNRAYRSRGRANSVLWELLQIHNESASDPRTCICGKPTTKCPEWQVLSDIEPGISQWEDRQIDRLNKELAHELPDSHPDVQRTGLDSHWQRRHFGHLPEL